MKDVIDQVQEYIDDNLDGEYTLIIEHPDHGTLEVEMSVGDSGIRMFFKMYRDDVPIEKLLEIYPDYKVKGIEITTRTTYPINHE